MGRHSLRVALTAAGVTFAVGSGLWAWHSQTKPPPPAEPAAKPDPSASADCSGLGFDAKSGGYALQSPCRGIALSPDLRFAVQIGEEGAELADGRGRTLDELTLLDDAMPFTIHWSPRSDWFFVNHYLGSSLERLHIFRIVNRSAVEQSSLFAEATRVAVSRYPCLGRQATVVASGRKWSRDGRRIAMSVYARTDACQEGHGAGWISTGDWSPLWMIGDVASGRIDPASIRVDDETGPMPKDGPYANL